MVDDRTSAYLGGKGRENALARAYMERMNRERLPAMQAVSEERRRFFSEWQRENSRDYRELNAWLCAGGRPSDYIRKEMGWIFGPFVPESRRESLLYAVDACKRYPYAVSWSVRSMREDDYRYHLDQICGIIQEYYRRGLLDMDVCDILEGRTPEDAQAYSQETRCGVNGSMIAYELDRGNARLERLIEDAMLGEGAALSQAMVLGVVQSGDTRMHKLLGKLLLAARLQEGLRQSICEAADLGTVQAFLLLLDVIRENNLIRYSSVKRAVGVWMGLMTEETQDLERISAKTLELAHLYLHDEQERRAALDGEDAVAIHAALWAYGVYDVKDAIREAERMVRSGSVHQALAAAYFAGGLNDDALSHRLSRCILLRFPDRLDVLAACAPLFLPGMYLLGGRRNGKEKPSLRTYFESEAQARQMHAQLVRAMQGMKKRKLVFSPCVFPWNSAELDRGWVAGAACMLAAMIGDADMIRTACGWIGTVQSNVREGILRLVAGDCGMQEQRDAVIMALADKDSFTRGTAEELAKGFALDERAYGMLEDLLRFKDDDIRKRVMQQLLRQEDAPLLKTIERLLGDRLEERRCAALDLMLQAGKDEKRQGIRGACLRLAQGHEAAQGKERVLRDNVCAALAEEEPQEKEAFEPYAPDVHPYMEDRGIIDTFMRYFPDSDLRERFAGGRAKAVNPVISQTAGQAALDILALESLIEQHKEEAYTAQGESRLLGYSYGYGVPAANREEEIPFAPLWANWYERDIGSPERLMRMAVLVSAYVHDNPGRTVLHQESVERLLGYGLTRYAAGAYGAVVSDVISWLYARYMPEDDLSQIAKAACLYITGVLDGQEMLFGTEGDGAETYVVAGHPQVALLTGRICGTDPESRPDEFVIAHALRKHCMPYYERLKEGTSPHGYALNGIPFMALHWIKQGYTAARIWAERGSGTLIGLPGTAAYIRACRAGLMTQAQLLGKLLEPNGLKDTLDDLTMLSAYCHSRGELFMGRNDGFMGNFQRSQAQQRVQALTGKDGEQDEDGWEKLLFADGICRRVVDIVLADELARSEMEGRYSEAIGRIRVLYGARRLMQILSALGSDKLVRSTYLCGQSRRENLCCLLSVCVPEAGDSPEQLRQMALEQGIPRQRLIEAAMYAPEWIGLIGQALGIAGFEAAVYYFMAHMNDALGERRMARIARFTPLSEEELRDGAFDADWFRQVMETVGEEEFGRIYDAAKYITDGAKHTRARRYADAVSGKLTTEEAESGIREKRNKDMIVAYSLIPLRGEEELAHRYLFLQAFLKSGKDAGAQRMASEKKLVEVSLRCLAMNAGYADAMRLTLRMEAGLAQARMKLFEPQVLEDVTVCLRADGAGRMAIACEKGTKTLKSVPARLKKHPYIAELMAAQKELNAQQGRARCMLETAMEDETPFTAGELLLLEGNAVIAPMLHGLLYKADRRYVWLQNGRWIDCDGQEAALRADEQLVIAHPWHMWHDGVWTRLQDDVFARRLVQPFKQVFRELYVKTDEERSMLYSLRYAGNQIQPKKTMAVLKARRWVADMEAGLQKIDYRRNIIATICAMADWFAPSDIEAPTLESVQFMDRRTGKGLRIEDVPDVLFSEVMRDADLAVSTAHAGEVDPMTSHSTIEVRAALLRLTLPLFGLHNVRVEGNHARIDGQRASYSVHLGSGVVHQQGGTMLNILPVHSQHRGKLFLPFADENPKTAEILSKVLLLAEDRKIKDPAILAQIG